MSLRFFFFLISAAFALLTSHSYAQAVMRNGDVFEMRLSGMPIEYASEFALQYTVGDDGEVSIPLIGQQKAAGLSTTAFARNVEKKLIAEKIFTNPTVVINLQAQSRFVTVGGGGVRNPSAVPWSNDMTLSVAIKRASGFADFARQDKIRLTREGKTTIYNLKKAVKDPSQNPKLLPGDEVEVPE